MAQPYRCADGRRFAILAPVRSTDLQYGVTGMTSTFVIGATGYIGGRLTERLAADGYEVRGLAHTPESEAELRQKGYTPFRPRSPTSTSSVARRPPPTRWSGRSCR